MIQSREAAATALFKLLQATTGITNAQRSYFDSTAFNSADMPALELVVKQESAEMRGTGLPIVWKVHYFAYLYASTGDPGNLAETQLNNFLDSIEAALKPAPATGKQTLGGVVFDCRINGPIVREPAFTSGIGAAAIPIEVTTTS